MRTGSSSGPQLRTKRSRGALNCLANVLDEALHERFVIAFSHHADQGFGTRLADYEPSAALQLGLRRGDTLAHAIGFQRCSTAVETNVLQQLGHRLEQVQYLARRLPGIDQSSEHLKRREANERLTVVRSLSERLPHEELVYLGDTARVPYGSKSAETVARYSRMSTRFLLEQGVKLIVVACNTASA